MEQREFRMPATGEAWRHYKGGSGSLYTIVGMAHDDKGDAIVVYTPYRWSLVQLPPLYTQPLGRFLQTLDNHEPRFKFEREPEADETCPFIRDNR